MATLSEFLQSGRLGDILIGITLDRATKILGRPDAKSVRRTPVEILRYGALELSFRQIEGTVDRRLVAVALYFHDPKRSLPESVRPTDWLPTGETTEAECRQYLQSVGVRVQSSSDGECQQLVLSSGATIAFADGKLHSMHFRRGAAQSPRKQISLSLASETVEVLRARAREHGLSVREVAERLLSEKAGPSKTG